MGKTSNKAKDAWNASHYTQIKVSVDSDLASLFKTTCAATGVSMASVISQYMAGYCKTKTKRKPSPDYSTRQQRRSAVEKILVLLELVLQAEEAYADNIPANLRNSIRYTNAEQSVNTLDEAISVLEEVY
jgi:hypothetical protein